MKLTFGYALVLLPLLTIGCVRSKEKNAGPSSAPQAPSGELDGTITPQPMPFEGCAPGNTPAQCEAASNDLQTQNEVLQKEKAALEAELKTLRDQAGEAGSSLERTLLELSASQVALEQAVSQLAPEIALKEQREAALLTARKELAERLAAHKALRASHAALKEQLDAPLADESQRDLKVDELQRLALQLSASDTNLQNRGQVIVQEHLTWLRQLEVLVPSSGAKDLRAALEAQMITEASLEALAADAALAELATSSSKAVAENEVKLKADLAKNKDELTKLIGSHPALAQQLEALQQSLMSNYREQYQKLDELELAMAEYLRGGAASGVPAARESKLKDLIKKHDTLKATLSACEKQSNPNASCLAKGQELFNLDRQRKMLLIDIEHDKEFGAIDLKLLAAAPKKKLEDLWKTYDAVRGGLSDLRGTKKLTPTELERLEAFL